jgi:hypothetical protein
MLAPRLARPRCIWPLDLLALHENRVHALLEARDDQYDASPL